MSLQEFNEKLQELHSVRAELERVRKDKNIISGLVNQTQRDMSSKVLIITTELEIWLFVVNCNHDVKHCVFCRCSS